MRINKSIPGQMSEAELNALARMATEVPEGGIIVEVGALYGLGSWHISQNTRKNVTLFCVDPWERVDWIVEQVEIPQKAERFGQDGFRHYTRDCHNIVMVPGYSPTIASGWKVPIDMYYEDSVHTNPILLQNISFWAERVKPGGIVCGHDYTDLWPDVAIEAEQLARSYGTTVQVTETFWSIRKPRTRY